MKSRTLKITISCLCCLCAAALITGSLYLFFHPAPDSPIDDGFLHIYFLDVGQGDAIYVRGPGGHDMLMDAGPPGPILNALHRAMLPGDTTIDLVFESHPDADHIGGMPDILRNFEVGEFFEPGIESKNQIDDEIKDILRTKNIPRNIARRGMEMPIGTSTTFKVLFPDKDVSKLSDTNEASIVGQIIYGSTTIMLTGDSPKKVELHLLKLDPVGLKSDILKLGHHGSRTSSSGSYVAAVAPSYAIISAGANNRYGHPHKETLDTLTSLNIPALETATLGTIEFVSDGKTLWRK